MHPVVIHIASGHSLFTGAALLVLAAVLRHRSQRGWLRRVSVVAGITGYGMAVLSANPFHTLTWICLAVAGMMAFRKRDAHARRWMLPVACCCWGVVCLSELVWQLTPRIQEASMQRPVVVLADSVTAGLGEGEATTWPTLLGSESSIAVMDLSHVGETVASALKRVQGHELPQSAVVILELGGNDLLGGTSTSEFESGLELLLEHVTTEHREVYMFELPLPPFHNRWGRIQRQQATKHGVKLIPRRELASVFSGRESTFDSIHLTQVGHQRLLKIVQYVLRISPETG